MRPPRAPQRSPRGFLGSQEAPKRLPRALQRSPGGSQDTPKSAQKTAKRAPRRSQDHLRIGNVGFSKIELPLGRELDFRGSENHLGSLKSASRSSKRRKRRFGRRQEPKKQRREPQEAPEEAPSHDPSALPSDYDLPRSPEGHRGCVDGAATELRATCDGPNICRRRGPLKLVSKLTK